MAKRGRNPKTRRVEEDEQSTAAPPPPAQSPQQIIRHSARLAKRHSIRALLRSPVRNVSPAPKLTLNPNGSSASSPLKNIDDVAENVNDQEEVVSGQNPRESPVAPQPPPHQNPSERSVVISVNHTQIGEREANDDFDPEEVESVNPEPALVNVGRYRVKEEIAPLLRLIIREHGDIGEKSILKTQESLIFHFERICWAYNELKHKNYRNFPPVERKRIIDIVNDAAAINIKVDWFQKRLDEIENAFRYSKEYIALKEKLEENYSVITRIEAEFKKTKEEQKILCKELSCRKIEMNKTFGGSFVRNLVGLNS